MHILSEERKDRWRLFFVFHNFGLQWSQMLLIDLIVIKLSERFSFSQILLPFKQLSSDLQVTTYVAHRIYTKITALRLQLLFKNTAFIMVGMNECSMHQRPLRNNLHFPVLLIPCSAESNIHVKVHSNCT